MKIFLDTADTEVIGKHHYSGLVDGGEEHVYAVENAYDEDGEYKPRSW